MGREIITLQFGSVANYVGAHYWNFQDELLGLQEREESRAAANQVDLSTVYRTGESPQGEPTYTPRLVLFDLRGSLGGVSSRGSLYLDSGGPNAVSGGLATWGGRAEVHRAQPVPKSGFMQQLEEEEEERGEEEEVEGPSSLDTAASQLDSAGGVRFFTDYLKAHLHPRSLYQLEGVWAGVSEFGGFGEGAGYSEMAERKEGMAESIRFFAEECDSLQGFQCMVDDLSGFGQLAADVLQEVRDDYGSRPVLLFAVRPKAEPDPALAPAGLRRWQLGDALSHAVLSQRCDGYVVLAPPAAPAALCALRWQAGNLYHTTAICAAAIDTATLPYRLATGLGSAGAIGGTDMVSLAQMLAAQHSTPLAALSLSLPCPPAPADLQSEQQRSDSRLAQAGASGSPAAGVRLQPSPFTQRMTTCLTPGLPVAAAASETYFESLVLRGPRSVEGPLPLGAAGAALDVALAQEGVHCVRQRALLAQPLPIPLPFPCIFCPTVSPYGVPGMRSQAAAAASTASVASCPVLTRLGGTAAFQPVLRGLLRQFRSAAGVGQGQATLEAWGYGREEVGEVCERLSALAGAYDMESL